MLEQLRLDALGGRAAGHVAAVKISEANAALRALEAFQLETFNLVRDAETAAAEARLQVRFEMTPESGAAYRAWMDRPGTPPSVLDPLESIPEFLRA